LIGSRRQKQVPTYGHHTDVSLFGAVNVLNGGTILQRVAANATTFLDFLKILKNHDPNKRIVLVLDHARIHHAKMVKDFLRQAKRGDPFISSFCLHIRHS
jgi:hypothetical protein